MVVDYIFIAYYPLNQMYSDYVIPVIPSVVGNTVSASQPTIMPNTSYFANMTNSTDVATSGDEFGDDRIISTLSNMYDKLKDTGLYDEKVLYEKRFNGENRDSIVTGIISYINIDYILDN